MKHIKYLFPVICFLVLTTSTANAANTESDSVVYPVPKFAMSVNPLGFIQFGPVLSGEFGLNESTLINAHMRFSSLGLLSWVIRETDAGLDELDAFAFGAGIVRFMGYNQNRPYIGFFLERETSNAVYASGYLDEWSQDNKTTVFIFNIGYRFNFNDGFFINTGAFFGGAATTYEWRYKYPDLIYDPEPRSGEDTNAFGMFEVSFGYSF